MIQVNNQNKVKKGAVRFVCISDTHGRTNVDIPDGDVLIHAGDLTLCSSMTHFYETIEWLSKLPHRLKIITAGNHDHYLDLKYDRKKEKEKILLLMKEAGLIYLEHEKYTLPKELGGFKLFVSPYAPLHYDGAFMLEDLSNIWNDIDEPIDILVTHTPPNGYLDTIRYRQLNVGCSYLKDKVDDLQPKVHVFGHIHESHGYMYNDNGQLFINACICNHQYRPDQKPITFDLFKNKKN